MKVGGAFTGVTRMHTKIDHVQAGISLDCQLNIIGYLDLHITVCVCFTGYSNGRELACRPVYQNKIEGHYEGPIAYMYKNRYTPPCNRDLTVQQVCILSRILFTEYTHSLVTDLDKSGRGCYWGSLLLVPYVMLMI